jgi:hypothetical protein
MRHRPRPLRSCRSRYGDAGVPVNCMRHVCDVLHCPIPHPTSAPPPKMLSCVITSLREHADLASCVATSRRLAAAVRGAHLSYALSDKQRTSLSNPAAAHCLDKLVSWLVKHLSGGVECLFAWQPITRETFATLPLHTHLPPPPLPARPLLLIPELPYFFAILHIHAAYPPE